MKITDVRCIVLTSGIPYVQWVSDIEPVKTHTLLVRVFTDAGIEGNCTYNMRDRQVLEHIETICRPRLIGQDIHFREAIWQELWRSSRLTYPHQFVQGVVDVCLWDIAGKATGLPIHKMLGSYRERALAYASTRTLKSIEEYVEEVSDCVGRGYRACKLHAYGDPKKDLAVCVAVRRAVGDDVGLMLDAVGAYTRTDALWMGKELERLEFLWLEEPLPDWDIEGYAQLCHALTLPIAGTEVTPGSIYLISEYLLRQAVDIVRGDVISKGGIGPLKKIVGTAEAFGMNCEIHTTATPLANAANLHVMCSSKNSTYHELLIPEPYFSAGVVEDIAIEKDGYVKVPDAPGLGLDLDWRYIDAHKTYETSAA